MTRSIETINQDIETTLEEIERLQNKIGFSTKQVLGHVIRVLEEV